MSPESNDPEPLSLLCIDDDLPVLETFSRYFEKVPGITLDTCQSAADALDLMRSQHYDGVFCDFSMPDMDGIELLRTIRSQGNTTFFIIVTGRHLTRVAIDLVNSGGNYYLQKGFSFTSDIPKVIALIRNHRDKLPESLPPAPADDPSQLLIDSHFIPVCGFDRNGRIRYTNRFFTREIGKSVRGGAGYYSIIPDNEREEFSGHLTTLSQQNPDIHLLHHIRSEDSLKLVLGSYRAFMDDSGEVTGYNAFLTTMAGIIPLSPLELHSLTEPKVKTEPEVQKATVSIVETPAPPVKKKSRQKKIFSELAESVEHVHYPLFAVDTSGKVVAWNRAIEDLTGVEAAEIIGRDGYAHAAALTGEERPMLIDYIVSVPRDPELKEALGIIEDGDVFTCTPETVRLQEKTIHLTSKGACIYDAEGTLIAAIQSIMVSTEPLVKRGKVQAEEETYIGGISSIILKVTDAGMGGAIAGAIGSAVGGYGVYVTTRRLFVIHNPELDARRNDGMTFGTFILGEFFGTNVDTRQRDIADLEQYKVFEVWRDDIAAMLLKQPKLLAGSLEITTTTGGKFRVYIDHAKAFSHLEQLLKLSYPEILKVE